MCWQVFAVQLQKEMDLANQLKAKHALKMQTLLCDMLMREPGPVALVTKSPNICDLVQCDGAALLYNGRIWRVGSSPPTELQVKGSRDPGPFPVRHAGGRRRWKMQAHQSWTVVACLQPGARPHCNRAGPVVRAHSSLLQSSVPERCRVAHDRLLGLHGQQMPPSTSLPSLSLYGDLTVIVLDLTYTVLDPTVTSFLAVWGLRS